MDIKEIHDFFESIVTLYEQHKTLRVIMKIIFWIILAILLYKIGVAFGKFAWNVTH